ncbi:hypothetical protein P43SY_004773 [Pythium insidiosum]|uniref:Uncharacterized protein n=1 Tax=Pythium insidiosum TaxID=114742 RepID=A0AAD5QDU2_PYTIN|nr:hypothetical protein P43SY_004773 [Pythium insidiosum]
MLAQVVPVVESKTASVVVHSRPSASSRTSHVWNRLSLPKFRLHLTESSFLVIWWFVVGLHIASLLTFARRVFNYVALLCSPRQRLIIAQFGVDLNESVAVSTTVVWIIITLLHMGALVRIAVSSRKARRLIFPERPSKVASQQARQGPRKMTMWRRLTKQRPNSALRRWVLRPLGRVISAIDTFLEPVSMTGRHFELAFNTRELVEIVFQGLQAYFMSTSVPHRSVNKLQVAICITNCWSTPVIQHLYSHDQQLERLLCVAADTFCTFLTMAVSPVIANLIYGENFSLGAPTSTYLIQNKINQLLCNSWIELILNIGGGYFLSSGLKAIKQSHCAVIEINCGVEGIEGRKSELDVLFQDYQLDAINVLIFSECSQLDMPGAIQRLPLLYRLDVFNSTVRTWGDDAAVTQETNPALGLVVLARVRNISTWPLGLSHDSFPSRLRQIYACDTDLSVLPDHVVRMWPDEMLVLSLEQSALAELPRSLSTKRIQALSVAKSRLTVLPSDLNQRNSLQFLSLAGTPLQSLSEVEETGSIVVLDVSWTNVSSIPSSWRRPRPRMVVRAGRTPLCDAAANATLGLALDCSTRDETSLLLFPVHSYKVN